MCVWGGETTPFCCIKFAVNPQFCSVFLSFWYFFLSLRGPLYALGPLEIFRPCYPYPLVRPHTIQIPKDILVEKLRIPNNTFVECYLNQIPGRYSTLSWVRMCGPKFRPPPYNKTREDANLLPISKPFVS